MTDKSKRKVNPRRRLLFRLIFGIAILITLIASGVYLLRPKGAQIVFIAPDENGVNQVWIADLNNPENPRQLTFHTTGNIVDMQIANDGSTIFYTRRFLADSQGTDNHVLNLRNNHHNFFIHCGQENRCNEFALSPDGRFVAFRQFLSSSSQDSNIMIFDIEKQENQIIYDFDGNENFPRNPIPIWIPDSQILVFRANPDEDEFIFYSVEEHREISREILNIPFLTPIFSDNGLLYGFNFPYSDLDDNHYSIFRVWNVDNPDDTLFELQSNISNGTHIFPVDWHPDNDSILVHNASWEEEGAPENFMRLTLFNITTGATDTLVENTSGNIWYSYVSFDHDGSLILYRQYTDVGEGVSQLMLFNMQTREEIALPLFGERPQWVNGGR